MAKTVSGKFLQVTKTTAEWAAVSAVIPKGLLCVELAGAKTYVKIGDGANTYAQLPYVTGDVDMNLYYTATQTDTKISNAIAALGNVFNIKGRVATVEALSSVADPKAGDVYLVGAEDTNNAAEYYYTTDAKWEYMGLITEVDLSGYYKKTEVDGLLTNKLDVDTYTTYIQTTAETLTKLRTDVDSKVAKETGKGLSTNDYTTSEKEKLAGIEAGAEKNVAADSVFNAESTNAQSGVAIAAKLEKYISTDDEVIFNCTL